MAYIPPHTHNFQLPVASDDQAVIGVDDTTLMTPAKVDKYVRSSAVSGAIAEGVQTAVEPTKLSAIKRAVKTATSRDIVLNGLQTISNIELVEGDPVLVKDQTAQWQNGIWTASAGSWSRSADFDAFSEVSRGTLVYVAGGDLNDRFYRVENDPSVIGEDPVLFVLANPTSSKTDATQLTALLLRNVNTRLPNPSLSSGGNFLADGESVQDGQTVFLSNQNAPATNGVYSYALATNTLTRVPEFAAGETFSQPVFVEITGGNDFANTFYSLSSPGSGIIGVDPTTWVDADTGAGVQAPNTFSAGPARPFYGSRPSSSRRLTPFDTAHYDNDISLTNFSQSVYANLNRFANASDYVQPASPFSNAAGINAAIALNSVVVFDKPVYLKSQLTLKSGTRLVFRSDVFMDSVNASFCDLSGMTDIIFEGNLRLLYLRRATAGVKAIKGTGFTRFRADRIYTEGVEANISVSGTIKGFNVATLAVGDLASDTPLFLSENHVIGTNAKDSFVGRIEGAPLTQTLVQNANFNYYPYTYAEVVNLTGAMTTNRTVVLTVLRNCTHGKRARFVHQGTGGFTWSIGALKTITNGQFAEVAFDGTVGAWVLTGTGTI